MRIFHLCAGAATGGAELAFVDTCIALHEANMDITAICRPHKTITGPLHAAGIPVFTLPFGGIFDFKTGIKLKALIKEHKPDIVQTWMNRAVRHCPRPSPDNAFKLVARLGGYYKLKNYSGVTHFVTNTGDIKDYLVKNGIPPSRVTTINNLVKIDSGAVLLNKTSFDTPEDAFVFLTLARLHPVKGIDDFITAMAKLPETTYGWIAGDGPEKEKLIALARHYNVFHRIRFLGWRSDKDALLKTADALVVPSRFEPFGNSFAQGWAAGCPLITTNSQGPMQYVEDGSDALVVPVNNPSLLADTMQKLMENTALGVRLAAKGLQKYEQTFTSEACVKAYEQLYTSLMQKNP